MHRAVMVRAASDTVAGIRPDAAPGLILPLLDGVFAATALFSSVGCPPLGALPRHPPRELRRRAGMR